MPSSPSAARQTPLMLTICSPQAVVIGTTFNHIKWLGRDRNGVIGHNCREWAHPAYWGLNWRMLQEAMTSGRPVSWEREILRPDGSSARAEIIVQPMTSDRGRQVALCSNRIIEPAELALRKDAISAADAAAYIEEMLQGLAEMSNGPGFGSLREGLEAAAREAAALQSNFIRQRH